MFIDALVLQYISLYLGAMRSQKDTEPSDILHSTQQQQRAKLMHTAKRIAAVIFCLSSLILIWYSISKTLNGYLLLDFSVYYEATKAFLAGQDPYAQFYAGPNNLTYIYPPGALLLFAPLTLLSQKSAQVVFTVLSIVLFLAALGTVFWNHWKKEDWWKFLFYTALLLQTFPFKYNLGMGQINAIVIGIAMLATLKRPYAGLLLAVAATLKLFPLGLLPILLLKKEYRLVTTTVICFALLNFWNLELAQHFFTVQLPKLLFMPIPDFPSLYSQSMSSILLRFGVWQPAIGILGKAVLAGYFIKLVFFAKKNTVQDVTIIAYPLLILFSGHGWQHYFVLAYPLILRYFTAPSIFIFIWSVLALHFIGNERILHIMPFIGSHHGLLVFALLTVVLFYPRALKKANEAL